MRSGARRWRTGRSGPSARLPALAAPALAVLCAVALPSGCTPRLPPAAVADPPAGSPVEDDTRQAAPVSSGITGRGAAGPAVADFDRDGYPDAAAAVPTGVTEGHLYGVLAMFRGGPDGLRPAAPLYAGTERTDREGRLVAGFDRPVAAELTGDRYPDLLVNLHHPRSEDLGGADHTPFTRTQAAIIRGGPSGLHGSPEVLALPNDDAGDSPHSGSVGDFDGDGHADVVAMGRILFGPLRPGARTDRRALLPEGLPSGYATVADFDRDGRDDLLLGVHYGPDYAEWDEDDGDLDTPVPLHYLRGTPRRGLVEDTALTDRLSAFARRTGDTDGTETRAGTDFDGDRHPDILIGGQSRLTVRVLHRGGPGGIRAETGTLTVRTPDLGSPVVPGSITGRGVREAVSHVHYGRFGKRGRVQIARLGGEPGAAVFGTTSRFTDQSDPAMPGAYFRSATEPGTVRDAFGESLAVLDADRDGYQDILAGARFSGPGHRYGGYWVVYGGPDAPRAADVRHFSHRDLRLPAN